MKIKICGLTSELDASYINQYKVDMAGIVVFVPKSKRNQSIEQAKCIIQSLDSSVKVVAVVVSPTLEQVREIEGAGFHYIQIHGALSKELLDEIRIPVLRAFNVTDMDSYERYHACDQIVGYVFDAVEPGSGKTFDWSMVNRIPRDEKMLILAGGLNATNVADAISYVKPDGVDVSSGVEQDAGVGKDEAKIAEFVAQARKIN